FDLGFTTLRLGYGLVWDFVSHDQDEESKEQITTENKNDLRDFRFLFKGKFKTKRPLSWTMGVMYDGPTEDWLFRQTGLMVGVPEISSDFFIGRTKEGYSQYKVMVGYDLWTIERSFFNDAFIPILADGIKWSGHVPRAHLTWNLGYYADVVSEDEKFSTYDDQFVGRFIVYPVLNEQQVLHLAVMGRDVTPDEGSFRARSRPESFLSPYFVDTGAFETDHARTFGLEGYYRNRSWLVGGEYGIQNFDAPASGDPTFTGGNLSVVWLPTGETRGYNSAGGFFKTIIPRKTVFEGGPGAIELSLNYSWIDLDDGALHGGTMWRVSPSVSWHLMDYTRIQFAYGYGVLDRFDLEGTTQFFQLRLFTGL
ncbi:MAG TPA: porin, partial [Candidatus Eisenbacteria bacterium]